MSSKVLLVELIAILFVMVLGICIGQTITVVTDELEEFKEGEEAMLTCRFTPAEAPVDITWVNGDKSIIARNIVQDGYEDRFSLKSSGSQRYGIGDLIIKPVTREDIGTYRCIVYGTTISKYDDGYTVLDVQWLSIPHLALIPDEKREYGFDVDDNATLICGHNGNPKPEIIWYKNNDTLQDEGADMDRYNANGTFGHLTITNITLDDHAVFNCSTTNNIGTTTSGSIALNIRHTPIVELVFEGGNQVRCNTSSFPLPYIYKFFVDGEPQSGKDNVLLVKIDDPSSCVNVTCVATNVDGNGFDEKEICISGNPIPEPVQKLKGGEIAGIVIGCIVGLCLIIVALIYVWKKHKSPATSSKSTKKKGDKAIYKPVTGEVKVEDAIEAAEKSESPKSTANKQWV